MHRTIINLLLLFNITLILIACNNTPNPSKPIDPNESAIPHGTTLTSPSLNEEDKQKLAKASGIIATPMNVKDLVNLIDNGSFGFNIYCLWKLDCPECNKLLLHLTRLKEDLDQDIMAIHHINVNVLDDQDRVNSHIRALGLINNNYILEGLEDYASDQPYSKLFHSELPILVLVNNEDGTKLIYKQAFSFEELYALIQPLII